MKNKILKSGFALSTLALAVSPAMATELRFDGFASFVAGQVLDKDELVGSNFRGFDERLSFQENSLFAIQARADLQDKLSATAQIIAKGSDDYNAKFNWAYLSYEINNEWTAKFGRSRIPYFLYSDVLDVGYAYHWISPPDSVYNLAGFDSADGITLDYQTDIAGWTSRLSMMGGRADTTLSTATGDADTRVSDVWVLAWSMNYDWLTLRIVHAESELTITTDLVSGLAAGLGSLEFPPGTTLISQDAIDDMLVENDRASFDGVAVAIDTGQFFAIAEYTELGIADSFLEDPGKRWYVSGGVRFGDFTAYATVEGYESDLNVSGQEGITDQLDVLAPFVPFMSDAERAGYEQLYGGTVAVFSQSQQDQDTYSVGLRYNFHPSAAAKLEFIQQDDKVNEVEPQAIAFAIDLVY